MISDFKFRHFSAAEAAELSTFLHDSSRTSPAQRLRRPDQRQIIRAEDLVLIESLSSGQMQWFAIESEQRLRAVAGLRAIPFDTGIYGMNMAEVMRLTAHDRTAAFHLLSHLQQFTADSSIAHLACRVSADDVIGRHALENAKFLLMDTSVEYFWNPQLIEVIEQQNTWHVISSGQPVRIPKLGLEYRVSVAEDAQPLADISRETFTRDTLSRYANDPALPLDLTGELYDRWARNAVAGKFGDFVLVVEAAGRPAGFQVLRCERTLSASTGFSIGTLGIAAVLPQYRGHGVFPGLLAGVLKWGREHGLQLLRGRTLANNVSMHQTCHALGGVLCGVYHAFHFSHSHVTA
ncbi:MAG TPA: hypothetical protein VJW20_04235 [Candidatus Angelobacter sp.]|nr:hypothetical protein [Candidatus Angelobacter sp.]